MELRTIRPITPEEARRFANTYHENEQTPESKAAGDLMDSIYAEIYDAATRGNFELNYYISLTIVDDNHVAYIISERLRREGFVVTFTPGVWEECGTEKIKHSPELKISWAE